MWLAVASPEAERALRLMQEFWESGLDDEGRRASAAVLDLDAETLTCPACCATFASGSSQCPDCGLRIDG
jgi:hypothetical protein